MSIENKEYFHEDNSTPLKRGDRFIDEHKPSEETMRNFNDSKVHKTPIDRAKEDAVSTSVNELAGHVVASTDAQAKANEGKKEDRTLSAQPSQLPTTAPDTTTLNLEASALNPDYSDATSVSIDDNFIDVNVDIGVSTRNVFLTGLKSTFATWFTDFVDSFNDIVSKVKDLKATQTTQQSQIDGLTAASGDVGDLINQLTPIGSTYFHVNPVNVNPQYWAKCDGITEYPRYVDNNPANPETLGYQFLNSIGLVEDIDDNFVVKSFDHMIPYQNPFNATGLTSGAWGVELNESTIPKHRHSFNTKTEVNGAHNHYFKTGSPRQSGQTTDFGKVGVASTGGEQYFDKTDSNPDAENGNGEHDHIISGNTDYTGPSNSVFVNMTPPQFNGGWIIKIA